MRTPHLEVLLEKVCTVARELDTGGDIVVDYELEGFAHMYDDGVICINWRSMLDELCVFFGLENGVFVTYRGRVVLAKNIDSSIPSTYEHGDWEQHIDTL